MILLDVSKSLRLDNLLKVMSGLSRKICCKSSGISMIFQLSLIILFTLVFLGLYLVIMT